MAHHFELPQNGSPLHIQIMRLINRTKTGYMTLADIQEKHFPTVKMKMKHILKSIQMKTTICFVTDSGNVPLSQINVHKERVFVKAPIRLCPDYIRKDVECYNDCGDLHMCRSALLGVTSTCPYKSKCTFGHSFYTPHNSRCLRECGMLESFTIKELTQLFRRACSRTPNTMPEICVYYNSEGGNTCNNKRCSALHICDEFITGEPHRRCDKNHQFSSSSVQRVLRLYAMSQDYEEWTVNKIIHFFRNEINSPTVRRPRPRQLSDTFLPSQGKLVVEESSDEGGEEEETEEEEDEEEEHEEGEKAGAFLSDSNGLLQSSPGASNEGNVPGWKALYKIVLQQQCQLSALQSQVKDLQEWKEEVTHKLAELA